MFNHKGGFGLFQALGVAGFVALAGAGTYYWMSRSRSKRAKQVVAQAKKVIHRGAPQVKLANKSSNHARTNHATHHARA